jgi:DNA replication protein DnaC
MTTINQLHSLRLHGMLQTWQAWEESRSLTGLTLTEGLDMLLAAETEDRKNRRFQRLEQLAGFRYKASLEEIRYKADRNLDRGIIARLSTCEYIKKAENLLLTGLTGSGKSFLACALGHQSCQMGHSVMYFSHQKLLLRLKMARTDATIYKFFEKLAKTELLIIDDFGMSHLDKQQRLDMMELMEDRHGKQATIIASQLPVANWYEIIGEDTIADAILDRLVHSAHRIELSGESLRKKP